jgi:hypothetical protein
MGVVEQLLWAGRMHEGKMVFSQVMAMLPWWRFRACVERYQGDQKVISFSCREFFLVMAIAQITRRDSLSSTALCLNALPSQRYQPGIQSKITKSATTCIFNEQHAGRCRDDHAGLQKPLAR